MFPRDFGNSTMTVTIPLEEVGEAPADLRRLLEHLEYRGMFDAELKLDRRDGRFKLLEVNARAWWQIELAAACGVDVCVMAYRDALGLPVEPALGYEIGRRWVHPACDARAWWQSAPASIVALRAPPLCWLGASQAVLSWDDPLPATGELGRIFRRGGNRRFPPRAPSLGARAV